MRHDSRNRIKILVVEDEPKTGDFLQNGLAEAGFVVDVACDGVKGCGLALGGDYDLVLLDVMLPGMDGWQILRELRKQKDTPVLVLTARSRVEERVKGLELGADDYVVKPFAFSELLARIRSLLRRGKARDPCILRVADLEVDLVERKAWRAGERIALTMKEFALLALLLRRGGAILSRTEIAEQVWDLDFDSDTNVVDVAVKRLRAKVDDPFDRKLIHTVRGAGYLLKDRG